MSEPYVVLAGATGNQGGRTAAALVESGAGVRALVRPGANAAGLQALGVDVVPVDMDDVTALAAACKGATCVVSTLGGLRDVILERQSLLLDAAVAAEVSRFISSDYSADYTKTQPGGNRNFDLRREFMGRADRAQIATTSIFNGAFLDMLGAEMPIIQPRIRRVLYWGDRYQPLDFTTRDDVAQYTARVAGDDSAPRILRIAGATVSASGIAATMSEVTAQSYQPLRAGGLRSLGVLIRATQILAPQQAEVFPTWQGMQYMRDQFSGAARLTPLDNDRYPGLEWTSLKTRLVQRYSTSPPTPA